VLGVRALGGRMPARFHDRGAIGPAPTGRESLIDLLGRFWSCDHQRRADIAQCDPAPVGRVHEGGMRQQTCHQGR